MTIDKQMREALGDKKQRKKWHDLWMEHGGWFLKGDAVMFEMKGDSFDNFCAALSDEMVHALKRAKDCIENDGWSDGPYLRETVRIITAALGDGK